MIQSPDLTLLARAAHDDRLAAAAPRHPEGLPTAPTPPLPARDGGADAGDYLAIHHMIRRATRALRRATDPGRRLDDATAAALRTYWHGYAAELHMHHTVEDTIFFPALIERDPSAIAAIARTDADHAELDELIAAGNSAFGELVATGGSAAAHDVLVRLDQLMTEHLDFEDRDLLPRFPARFTQAEYDALHARAMKLSQPLRQLVFVVGFVRTWIDRAAWERLWATAPLPMRVIHRLTRRRHARLARAAFGTILDELGGAAA